MGNDINVHNQWAVESQCRMQNRTKETLASSDVAIKAYRKNLIKSIQQMDLSNVNLSHNDHSIPKAIDVTASLDDWEKAVAEAEAKRRQSCSWKNTISYL